MKKDTPYYDKEGAVYSKKRYPDMDTDYVHFFFKKRRAILMEMLARVSQGRPGPLPLLEVGCADGVIIREIRDRFETFRPLVGIDVSPGMIEAAKADSAAITFHLRDEQPLGTFAVVVEVGVVNLTDLETEFRFAQTHLQENGYYICSLASKTSLLSRLKLKKAGFAHHLSYAEYEAALERTFVTVEKRGYGVFVPHLWKWPWLARRLQPIAERLTEMFVPTWFHERIYLLKTRD